MKKIAYFVPEGQHDWHQPLGGGWGPRTVLEDGTVYHYDARQEVNEQNLEEIEQRLRALEAKQ